MKPNTGDANVPIEKEIITMLHVTVWNEFRHEKVDKAVTEIYPKGIHGCIKDFLDKIYKTLHIILVILLLYLN